MKGFHRGHEIVFDGKDWIYTDNGVLVKSQPNRNCFVCGEDNTAKGYDPCLGDLPGVLNACCGHGIDEGYIQFENGLIIRGKFKIEKKESIEPKVYIPGKVCKGQLL